MDGIKEKLKSLPLKKIIPIALIILIVLILVIVLVSCGKNDPVLTDGEAAALVLDDGDEAWIQEYLAGDTGLHKGGNVEGVDNKTATSAEGNLISWEAEKGAVAYKVFRSDKKDGEYECIATVTETSYLDKEAGSKQYYYKTVAIKQGAVKTTKPKDSNKPTEGSADTSTTLAPTPTDTSGNTVATEANGTTAPNGGTTKPNGGNSSDSSTKPSETTTTPPETTTEKVIPSAPNYTPSQKDARNVRAVFEANARSATSAKSIAQACADKLGKVALGWGQNPVSTANGKIISLRSKSANGFTECYKFTKDPTVANGVKMIGYVFKVADDVDPASFVDSLKADVISDYRTGSSALTRVFSVSEVTTDYYDQYVLFVVTG